MLRLIIVLVLLFLLYLLIRAALKELRGRYARSLPAKDQMVQDPVCQVYIPRHAARSVMVAGKTYYFCGSDCAERFERQGVSTVRR